MRHVWTFACLLVIAPALLAQPPATKPLWSTQNKVPCSLLTTTPDGKELFTLCYKVENEKLLGLSISRIDVATGKELQNYPLEEIDTPEVSTLQSGWKEPRFDASPDGEILLITIPKPYSSTRQNVYGHHFVQLYDLKTGKRRGDPIPKIITHSPGSFSESSATCFSPDGKYFWAFTKGYGEQLNIYSSATGKVVFTADSTWPEKAPQSVAFSTDCQRAAIFWQTTKGYCVTTYSWPDAKLLKQFHLPTGPLWQMIHSWHGNLVYVEATEEDAKSKALDSGSAPHPIQAYKRACTSFDISADDPLTTLKKQPLLGGFRGDSLGMPGIFWDAGPTWIASYTQYTVDEKVQQAAAGQAKPLTFYYWRDAKVMNAKTGKVIFERKGIPYQTHVTQDGRYLIAVGSSPDMTEGIHVWRITMP